MGGRKGWQGICVEHTGKQQKNKRSVEGRRRQRRRGEMKQDGLCLSWLYWHQWEHLDEMENKTPSCVPFMSTWTLFPTHSHKHWQSEAAACGSSPVTAACSQGGDASGVAPHIGEACLCWLWINNFSFSAEMTGIVIKEMEWFYWPWCLY